MTGSRPKIVVVVVSAFCGFVAGATLALVMAQSASSAFAQALLAELDGSGYREALSRWHRADYRGSACYLLVLEDQARTRTGLHRSKIWSLEFPFTSRMLASIYAPKPALERTQADIYRLLRLRAEERSGVDLDPARYKSVADRMCLEHDVDSLRKMADTIGDSGTRLEMPSRCSTGRAAEERAPD